MPGINFGEMHIMATAICAVVPSLAFLVQTLDGWIHNLSFASTG